MAEILVGERYSDDILNTEVKDFALYTIRTRATLGLMDGLRLGARKIIWSGINSTFKNKNAQAVKYTSLMGAAFDNEYDHGDASLKKTIEQFSSRHVTKLAPFITKGQIPSLRSTTVDTAARYLTVGPSRYMDLYKVDLDLLTYNIEADKKVEPKFFLPIIPTALMYRTSSPGFGIGFTSFSYDLYEVVNALQQAIINGSCMGLHTPNIKPDVYGIDPEKIVYNSNKDTWYNIGDYEINGDRLIIKDLPWFLSITQYANFLEKMKEKGQISDYFDRSKKKPFFEIVFLPGRLKQQLSKGKFAFFNRFKLIKKLPNLHLNFIDVNDKIVTFENINEYIDYFVKRRLEFFEIRRQKLIKDLTVEIAEKEELIRFIRCVVTGTLKVFKRSKKDIMVDIERLKLTPKGLDLRISRYTNDEIDSLNAEIIELVVQLEYYEKITDKEMYLNDLVDLMDEYFRVDTINADGTVTKHLTAYDDNGYTPISLDDLVDEKPKRKKRTTKPKVIKTINTVPIDL